MILTIKFNRATMFKMLKSFLIMKRDLNGTLAETDLDLEYRY